MKKNNFHFVRQINEISVLRIVRDQGPLSRSEVARIMGLSKVIIGGIVARLLETEIIDRKSTRLNSSHTDISRMPSSA